jgi:hypothetical protein
MDPLVQFIRTRRTWLLAGIAFVPSAHCWPASEQAAFYQRFLFALSPNDQPDSKRDAARAKLVGRLLALTGDS